MLTLSVETLVELVDGELLCGSSSAMVNGLAIDSRRVEPGVAFVAFSGQKVDGHEYLTDAISMGARALLVTRSVDGIASGLERARERDVAVVRVDDSLGAVQRLATYHRSRLFCPVVGVTGSTGKTTTKDFITSVLSVRSRVVATEGNQNNELGVPLTILQAGADTDVLVVEMAMRGEGQISQLCEIARPTLGIVTNVGTSHMELLGTQEAIARAKSELVAGIPEDGIVFLNCDDAYSSILAQSAIAEVMYYGVSESCEIHASGITLDDESHASFELEAQEIRRTVTLSVPGKHNVYNALAACAVGVHLGVGADDMVEGLESARAGEMRMQSFQTASGVFVINDAYNANPTSMRAAIETLDEMATDGLKVAVLGDMAELGSLTELAHFRIGEEVARLSIDLLVTIGDRARRIGEGAKAEGMDAEKIRSYSDLEEVVTLLDEILSASDIVLVKASRVMGLERVVEGIVNPRV